MSQVDEFVGFAEMIAAGPYRYGSFDCTDRCNPLGSGCADCSGLVCASLRAAGGQVPCLGSFALSIACHQHGSGVSIGEARATRGALVFIGINEGQGGIPGVDEGHIAISRGDGTVVEARNHAAGILLSPFDNRGWVWAGLPTPWISMGDEPAPQPQPVQEDDMPALFVDEVHQGIDANHPKCASVHPDGTIVLGNGASLRGKSATAFGDLTVVPSEKPADWQFQGASPIRDTKTGRTIGFRYEATDAGGQWNPYVYYFA